MKTETGALLDKAEENIQAAGKLLDDGFYAIAVGRLYYAMFYCAEAIPLEEGLEFSSHGEVHGAFGRELIKSGKLPPELHQYLLEAFRRRQAADYDAPAKVTEEDVKILLDYAEKFYTSISEFISFQEK